MTSTFVKSCTISISICLAFMILIFSSVTGYALITAQTIGVLDLYIAHFNDDGMFIRISTDIWYVMAIAVTFLMVLNYIILQIRKGRNGINKL
ncbi:hypothetical protein [Rossellomorea sp. NPDC077527]|uniref:hypothetical protein n=1 Tax=Rossellomorea sp. NPDC077527 TaxID=3364510 RepID=UPI0037CAB03C